MQGHLRQCRRAHNIKPPPKPGSKRAGAKTAVDDGPELGIAQAEEDGQCESRVHVATSLSPSLERSLA